MCAGEGDIAAYSAADESKNCREESRIPSLRHKGVLNCRAYRWLNDTDYDKDHDDHDAAENLYELIHRALRIL